MGAQAKSISEAIEGKGEGLGVLQTAYSVFSGVGMISLSVFSYRKYQEKKREMIESGALRSGDVDEEGREMEDADGVDAMGE